MDISSEIFAADGSNSSDYLFFNTTEEGICFNMFSTVCSINVLLGFPINTYVISLILIGTVNGLTAEYFTLNLSICEMFFYMESLLVILSCKCNFLWKVVYFLDGLATTSRPLFQCLICVERYLAVVHPVTFLKYKPLRFKVICSVFVWPVGLGSGLFSMISFLSSNTYKSTWFLQFFLFLSIQLFCCGAVLRALKQSGPGERGREKEEENYMKRRAFYLILITTVSMITMYVPFIVIGMIFIVTQQVISVFFAISFICFFLGSFVHPILYLHRTGKLSVPLKIC